ncbi:choice-of-anchor Q domain-containing protein, partial [Winogradskyella wichelsiae]|uniref:choice-of-anchor Q domain-containing protein n=1 Tax=Winogradskyella wichelsiae TaxID=2697007 RepID=UPI00293B9D37
GGGIYNYDNSSPSLTNTTVVGAIYNTVNGSVTLNSSIVWGGITGGYIANYSLIKDNSSTVNNNIDATALTDTDIFTDPSNGDYSLKDSSVAINAGNNASYTTAGGDLANDLDLAGNARLFGATIDLGAYENQSIQFTPDSNNILYVNKAVSGGTADGSSWSNALPELADALVWAKNNEATSWATTPLQIWVAGGTYNPLYSPEDGANFGTNQTRENTFLMVNNVQLYGGFAGTETTLTARDLSITTNT